MPVLNRTLADEAGFTLVEMLLVIVVLGILTSVVILGAADFQQSAARTRDQQNYRLCRTAKIAAVGSYGTEQEYRRFVDRNANPC